MKACFPLQDLIRDCSHTRVSQLQSGARFGEKDERKQRQKQNDGRRWYAKHICDIERSQITKEELCGLCWKFRHATSASNTLACLDLQFPCCRCLMMTPLMQCTYFSDLQIQASGWGVLAELGPILDKVWTADAACLP